ncbi:MAG: DUF47 domain-containing protein [Thermoplasmatota archaeon]
MDLKGWLIPHEERFFDLLEEESANVLVGAKTFAASMRAGDSGEAMRKRMKDIEHRGDELVHGIYGALNKSFITPIDREDISTLASALDDVLDYTWATANRLVMYEIAKPTPEIVDLANSLEGQVAELHAAILELRNVGDREALRKRLVEVHRIENHADDVANKAIADLFRGNDVKHILKMKEIYEELEGATDKCEDAADVLRDVIVKYA